MLEGTVSCAERELHEQTFFAAPGQFPAFGKPAYPLPGEPNTIPSGSGTLRVNSSPLSIVTGPCTRGSDSQVPLRFPFLEALFIGRGRIRAAQLGRSDRARRATLRLPYLRGGASYLRSVGRTPREHSVSSIGCEFPGARKIHEHLGVARLSSFASNGRLCLLGR